MRQWLRSHLTYPNVTATVALFIALGGTAYAAGTIGSPDIIDESILSQDVKNGEVKNPDLGANSVGTGKIIDGTVRTADVANDTSGSALSGTDIAGNSLTGADVLESSLGKVPSASDADLLNGKTAAQLEGPSAAAVGGQVCLGASFPRFCGLSHNRGVGYVVEVAAGVYCIGVAGLSPQDHVALVDTQATGGFGYWKVDNQACALPEFEVITGTGSTRTSTAFTIVIL